MVYGGEAGADNIREDNKVHCHRGNKRVFHVAYEGTSCFPLLWRNHYPWPCGIGVDRLPFTLTDQFYPWVIGAPFRLDMVAIKFKQEYISRTLTSIPVKNIYYAKALLPIFALISVFLIGIIFHPALLFDYHWACGKAHLPSISRIINMPVERTVFQLFILLDVPLRSFSLWYHANLVKPQKSDTLVSFLRLGMISSSVIEIGALSLLATVGENESGSLHVVFFCIFTFSSITYFLTHSVCLRFTSDRTSMYDGGFYGRIGSVLTLSLTVPLIFTFFTLYNGFCVPNTYELFALFEYITVGAMCFYHVTSYYQLCGQVVFVHPRYQLKKFSL